MRCREPFVWLSAEGTKLLLFPPARQTQAGSLEPIRMAAHVLPGDEVQIKVQDQRVPRMVPDTTLCYEGVD